MERKPMKIFEAISGGGDGPPDGGGRGRRFSDMAHGKFGLLILIVFIIILLIGPLGSVIDTNKSGELIVKQAAWTGTMSVIFKEGVFWQLWGRIERYPNSATYYFSQYSDEGATKDESIPVTFKNGSAGTVSGSIRYSYPQNEADMIAIHRRYRSDKSIQMDLVRTEVRKLVNMTASLMSPEAAMTQKGLFYQMLSEQIEHGQYQTKAAVERYEDPITKEVRYRDVVEVALDENKKPLRMDNPFQIWKIATSQLVVQNIEPDVTTKNMIAQRRDAEMKVMVAKADVERARQEKEKVIAEGQKAVSEKEYAALQEKETAIVNASREKEVATTNAQKDKEVAIIKAQQIVEVNQKTLESAQLDRQTAEQQKLAAIERGRGESEARKLIMDADGSLSRKLETYERVMNKFAESYATRHVPSIVSGGGGKEGGEDGKFIGLMEMFGYKVAKDLALDMSLPERSQERPQQQQKK